MSAKHPGAPRALLAALIATTFVGALATGCGSNTVTPRIERGTSSSLDPDGGSDAGPDAGSGGPDGGLGDAGSDAGTDAGAIDPLACAEQRLQTAADAPATLSGEATPACGNPAWNLCCPGGAATPPCGPIAFDLALQGGDSARLVMNPFDGGVDVTLRGRTSASGVAIESLAGDCSLAIDSTRGSIADFQITFQLGADGGALDWSGLTVSNLQNNDYAVTGGAVCNGGGNTASSTVSAGVTSAADDALRNLLCGACPCP